MSALPAPLPATTFFLDDPRTGRIACHHAGPDTSAHAPMVLVHSVNAAASAYEIRPLFEHYATSRPVFALDLPGFGLSERRDRAYTPRLMTDAVRVLVDEVRRRHGGAPVDALAVSLATEFLARAANEDAAAFRTVALVSPTGFDGKRREGPEGSTRAVPGMHAIVSFSLWDDFLFDNLTRPGVVRYFLEKTFGRKEIDEGMWAYAVRTAREPGAKHAPFHFLAAHMFSNDVTRLYDGLTMPVWMAHGVRGDFVDYRGAEAMKDRPNWRFRVFETGALPYFEMLEPFASAYDAFLAR